MNTDFKPKLWVPGDWNAFFGFGTNILVNLLTLTDEEREAMRAADPRTREILARTEALTPDELMRMHGRLTAR